MKIEISCELCRDLIPLVRDGVAGSDSQAAVEAHLESCDACRELYEAGIPENSGDQALSKAMKRVQVLSAAAAWALVLLGIVLCELVMRGSSVVFLLAVVMIRSLLRVVFSQEKGKTLKKTVALVSAVALMVGLCALGNATFGNPISRILAEKAAENYLAGKFPEGGYEVADTWFDAKRGHYEVDIHKIGSQDVRFSVDTDMKGNFHYDTYDDVLTGWNTAHRLAEEYQSLVEQVLGQLNLSYSVVYVSCDLEFEHRQWGNDPCAFQYILNGEALVPDGEYNVQELGRLVGKLRITVEEETVTAENAAQILLEIRRLMDEADVSFRYIDLTLRYLRSENGMDSRPEGRMEIKDFLYENIQESGLAQLLIDK